MKAIFVVLLVGGVLFCGGLVAGESEKKSAETWKDPVTGFTWEIAPTGGKMSVAAANAYCASLSLDGGGWHLPTKDELVSLIRGCEKRPCEPGKGPAKGCYWPDEMQGECSSWYWSSSPVEDNDNYAWFVGFDYGSVYDTSGSYDVRVRCVG